MKKLLFLIFFIALPIVYGAQVNNTLFNHVLINTTYNITYPMIAQRFTIAPTYLKLDNLTQSHPSQVLSRQISMTLTCPNANYTGLDIPYFSTYASSSTSTSATITSNVCNSNVTTSLALTSCSYTTLTSPNYDSVTCTNNIITFYGLKIVNGNNLIAITGASGGNQGGGGGGGGYIFNDTPEIIDYTTYIIADEYAIPVQDYENLATYKWFDYCSNLNLSLIYIKGKPYCADPEALPADLAIHYPLLQKILDFPKKLSPSYPIVGYIVVFLAIWGLVKQTSKTIKRKKEKRRREKT